ncbi:MAG: type II secretion system protein GspG [Verrucomicrobiales bacterium]|nr:type II secretion system protein GspG [Verrucomicrobiales bacterium]
MRSSKQSLSRNRQGFTLMELLIVISIMALLAGLVAATAQSMNRAARAKKAVTQIAAMETGLESYKVDYGEYPEAKGSSKMDFEGSGSYNVSGARMLYQALSGDGSDAISGTEGSASNGQMGDTTDGEIYLPYLDPENNSQNMVANEEEDYYLADPFGKPYQYRKAGGPERTNNITYDLWSFGPKEASPSYNPQDHPATWLTNW